MIKFDLWLEFGKAAETLCYAFLNKEQATILSLILVDARTKSYAKL